jgi:hypothetical protein
VNRRGNQGQQATKSADLHGSTIASPAPYATSHPVP